MRRYSEWNWTPQRAQGIWHHGAPWQRPFVAAVPWITLLLLLLMIFLIGGTMTSAKGILFELPDVSVGDGAETELVAVALPQGHDTLVFFDDSRYVLGDEVSERGFSEHLRERVARSENRSLLVMADCRISTGELMRLASAAKAGGVEKVLFAEKTQKDGGE